MYGREKVAGSLVIACGDGSELLEPGEEILNQVASLEQLLVVISLDLAVGLGRDHHSLASGDEWIDHTLLGVERLGRDQRVSLHRRQQVIRSLQVVFLATGQEEADRIAERIDQGMDLGAQPTARAADRLVFTGFFSAPALC